MALGALATALVLGACSTGSSANASSSPTGDQPASSVAPGLADCDRQGDTVSTNVCSAYEDLWTCPTGHSKPESCKLSTAANSFCCLPTHPACTEYCAANNGRCEDASCEFLCAFILKTIGNDETQFCTTEATAYLECVAEAGTAECKDGSLYAASCEGLGEALITCQTDGNFVRASDDDAKCAAKEVEAGKKKGSRAFIAKSWAYSGSCATYDDGDDVLSDGELMCCSYVW